MKTIEELIKAIYEFNQARGWNPSSQDTAKSVVIEAAELLELFQWDSSDRNTGANLKPKDKDKLKAEIADVFWYLVWLCRQEKIELGEAIEYKIEYNEQKYPVAQFKGKHNDTFYLQRKAEYRQNRN